MDFNFLTELPSNEDRFNGKSHQLLADTIIDTFENKPSVNIIGLEGGLGSGKSTVIELIKKTPAGSTYNFFVFDIEQHHYSSTKKAFITLFADWISTFAKRNNLKAIEYAKDKALGNILEYRRTSTSSIKGATVAFIISLIVAVYAIKPLINHLVEYIHGQPPIAFFDLRTCLWLLIFISPGILLLIVSILRQFKLFSNLPTIGDLFKRNTSDGIFEKLEVTREVGSLELRDSMKVFVEAIPKETKCILVIDNLDRVSSDKVKEVWSDLEIFIEAAKSTLYLKIILPYSSNHIAKAISDDDGIYDGYEFISKRIPVSFRVPPIVSVGWQESFEKFWLEADEDVDKRTIRTCAYILDLLLPKSYNGHVTPRLMKRFINDIYSLIVTTPVEIHPAVSAFYVATTKYRQDEYNVEKIITTPPIDEIIRSIHSKLTLIIKSENVWHEQLMCLHYQTTLDIAKSELLNTPLDRGVKRHDAVDFMKLSDVYGFDEASENVIVRNSYVDVIKFIFALHASDKESAREFITKHSEVINNEIQVQIESASDFVHDSTLISALVALVNDDIPINIRPFEAFYDANLIEIQRDKNIKAAGKKPSQDNKFNGLDSLYLYSELLKSTPNLITNPDGDYFVNELWPNKEKFPYWDIENLILTADDTGDAILSMLQPPSNQPDVGLTTNLLNRIRLGWFDFSKGINNAPMSLPALTTFTQNADINNIQVLVFDQRWCSQDLAQYYFNNINRITQASIKAELVAQLLVHIINRESYNYVAQWKALSIDNSGFKEYLLLYLPLVLDFQKILNVLNRPEIEDVLDESLKSMLLNRKVYTFDINTLFKTSYSTIKMHVRDPSLILSWSAAWAKYLKYDSLSIRDFNNDIVEDILSLSESFSEYANILYSKIDNDTLSEGECETLILTNGQNFHSIIIHMSERAHKLRSSSKIPLAIENIFKNPEMADSIESINAPEYFDALISIVSDDSKERLLNHLSRVLLTHSIPDSIKRSLIINIGHNILLPIPTETADKIIIRDLFSSLVIDEVVASWLDNQNYNFDTWNEPDVKQVAKTIERHKAWFNRLYSDDVIQLAINDNASVTDDKKND